VEAGDLSALMDRGIDCVLSMVAGECGPMLHRGYPDSFETLAIDALDMGGYDIFKKDVPEALEFLEWCSSRGRRVLVHCYAGMNRSATVCAAWKLRSQGYPLDSAVRHMAMQRGFILGNPTFVCGLVDMARALDVPLSNCSGYRRQRKKERQIVDVEEKLSSKNELAERDKAQTKHAKTLRALEKQLVELEAAQGDKDWDEMTNEDEIRLGRLADLRGKISKMQDEARLWNRAG